MDKVNECPQNVIWLHHSGVLVVHVFVIFDVENLNKNCGFRITGASQKPMGISVVM